MSTLSTIQEKRTALFQLCNDLKAKSLMTGENVNASLVAHYEQQGHKNLKTFKQWLNEGFVVKKGEKCLLLWGAPKNDKDKETKNKFYPLTFVFSENQVQPRETENTKR